MNKTALFKALRFAFLPTAVVLLLMMFGFFSVTKVFEYISSNHGGAIAIRIILFILESALIYGMYEYYVKQLNLENVKKNYKQADGSVSVGYSTWTRDLFDDGKSENKYLKYKTEDPDVIIIQKKYK
jgi:hypothetical protein